MKLYDDYLRRLYRGGRPNWFARVQNRLSAIAFAAGVAPGRVAELQVRGRRTGRVIRFPVVIADYEGGRYLVSMLGDDVNWVRNLRAAGDRAVLRHGRREAVRLQEVSPPDRVPVLRRYLQVAPGARRRAPAPPAAVSTPCHFLLVPRLSISFGVLQLGITGDNGHGIDQNR